jgi:hypothetical protein
MTWREHISPMIEKTIAHCRAKGLDMKATRRALREANPYRDGPHWPYRIWCDEVRCQLGLKPRKSTSPRQAKTAKEQADPKQMKLF